MTRDPSRPLVGALLVGGSSRRFGSPKALARLRGVPLSERVARALAEVADEVLVVGAGDLPRELGGLPRVDDAPEARGPIAGVLGALRARPDAAVLAAACDQPLLDRAALEWLLDTRNELALAAFGRFEASRVEPLPGLFAPAARERLEAFAAADGSMQPLGRDPATRVREIPARLARAWTSVDRPEELAVLEAGRSPATRIDGTSPASEP